MRSLSAEERALWAKVASTIRPLSREPVEIEEAVDGRVVQPVRKPVTAVPAKAVIKPAPPIRPGTTLDGTWDRRISSGNVTPDRVLDLPAVEIEDASPGFVDPPTALAAVIAGAADEVGGHGVDRNVEARLAGS